MATRLPLVLVSGRVAQLPAGDIIVPSILPCATVDIVGGPFCYDSGLGTTRAEVLLLTASGGAVTWAGEPNRADGTKYLVINTSGVTVTVSHQDGSAVAAQRFLSSTGASIALANDAACLMVRDASAASGVGRWRVVPL